MLMPQVWFESKIALRLDPLMPTAVPRVSIPTCVKLFPASSNTLSFVFVFSDAASIAASRLFSILLLRPNVIKAELFARELAISAAPSDPMELPMKSTAFR